MHTVHRVGYAEQAAPHRVPPTYPPTYAGKARGRDVDGVYMFGLAWFGHAAITAAAHNLNNHVRDVTADVTMTGSFETGTVLGSIVLQQT